MYFTEFVVYLVEADFVQLCKLCSNVMERWNCNVEIERERGGGGWKE